MDLTANSKLLVSPSLLLTITEFIALCFESHSELTVNFVTASIAINFKVIAFNTVGSFTIIMDLLVDSAITIAVMWLIITTVIFISFVPPLGLGYLLQP